MKQMNVNAVPMDKLGQWVKSTSQAVGSDMKQWGWVKRFVHWLIMSAGTVSECAFLLASLWMSLNASSLVHQYIVSGIGETTDTALSAQANIAYIALPELIVGLAVVTTINHFRSWLYDKNIASIAWAILFVLPTSVFLGITLYTIYNSVTAGHANFQLPDVLVGIRALAGYWFAFIGLLYEYIGKPCEVDKLRQKDVTIEGLHLEMKTKLSQLTQEKDNIIAQLRRDKDTLEQTLRAEIARIQSELDTVYKEKDAVIAEKTLLYSALTQSSDDALQAYGSDVINWLNSLDKTVEIDDIVAHTGINKKRLQNAIGKDLRVRGTNNNRVWVPSLKDYLVKNAPKTEPNLHIVHG